MNSAFRPGRRSGWLAATAFAAGFSLCAWAAAQAASPADTPALAPSLARQSEILDAMSAQERRLWKRMQELSPRIETYMQNLRDDPTLGPVPIHDRYYLGLLQFHDGGFQSVSFLPQPQAAWRRLIGPIDDTVSQPLQLPLELDLFRNSFVSMLFPDTAHFDREHYHFNYIRREFLGEVRCYVFDVSPLQVNQRGAFFGRIWVEDQTGVLVRFNGTFWQDRLGHPDFHFDSWRMNVQPGLWLPTYIYSEESDLRYGLVRHARFSAVTQLWGYDLRYAGHTEELTSLAIEGADVAAAPSAPALAPVSRLRAWEQLAENNVLDRLEKAGLLAPAGPVDAALEQVADNLVYYNHLQIDPPLHCRVLLTTPLESLAIGHTIVLSRGLLDSLPDEASIAAMLAHELAHITLGQTIDTQYAFADRLMFADQDSYRLLNLRYSTADEIKANALAVTYLRNTPYAHDLARVGLFLRELDARRAAEPHLLSPHLGNAWFTRDYPNRLAALIAASPPLTPANLSQLAARPLGGRLLIDAWTGALSLQPNVDVPLLSAREKMPLQITPTAPYLKRFAAPVITSSGPN